MVLKTSRVKKGDRMRDTAVEALLVHGATRGWIASTFDNQPRRHPPSGPHCIGKPERCGSKDYGMYFGRDMVIRFP
jgi:hypothetical protein